MNQFEASIILWIQENLTGPFEGVWVAITHLGDEGYLWIALGILLLIFKKTRPIGFTMLVSLLVNFLIVNVTLKDLIGRPRPYVINEAITPLVANVNPLRSFPSGHTSGSFSAMFALNKWVPKKIGIPGLILASLIAISRWFMGVHYPTDVLAGVVIGYLSSIAAYYLITFIQKKLGERKQNG